MNIDELRFKNLVSDMSDLNIEELSNEESNDLKAATYHLITRLLGRELPLRDISQFLRLEARKSDLLIKSLEFNISMQIHPIEQDEKELVEQRRKASDYRKLALQIDLLCNIVKA